MYCELGEYKKALEDLTKVIDSTVRSRNSSEYTYFSNRGMAYFGLGEYTKALADYEEALRLNPQWLEAYEGRAEVYQELKQYDKAIADYTAALQLKPSSVLYIVALGNLFGLTEQHQQALDSFNKALALRPDTIQAYFGKAYAYYSLEDYQKALDNCNQALQLNKVQKIAILDVEIYRLRGKVYLGMDKFSDALKDLNESIKLDPEDSDTINLRDRILNATDQNLLYKQQEGKKGK